MARGPQFGATEVKAILAKALRAMRSTEQDGYGGYLGNGKWNCLAVGVMFTITELTTLFRFVGIEPDPIIPKGRCGLCKYAEVQPNGLRTERGYASPCAFCLRPKMSNFHT